MQGNGGSTETPLNYFFLDSSYISILLQYGLIMFVMILILWGIIGLRARKEKDWVLLADSCDHCISEYYGTAFAGYFI